MKLGLQALGVIQGVVLVGVGQSRKGSGPGSSIVTTNSTSHQVGCLFVLHEGCDEYCKGQLVVAKPARVLTLEEIVEQRIDCQQVGMQ